MLLFFFGFYCRRLAPKYFFMNSSSLICVASDNMAKKIKPGLPAAFAQTSSSLSLAFFPMPLHRSWAGTEHFQLILSFLKMSAFIHFAFNFFFQSPTEMDCQLKSFISFHSDKTA